MKPFRSLFAGALALLLFCAGAPAHAQPRRGQWVGDHYLVEALLGSSADTLHAFLIDENDEVHLKIPNFRYSADFPIPRDEYLGPFSIVWHDGAAYSLACGPGNELGEDGRRMRRHFYAKWEDGAWSLLGEFKVPRDELFLHPIPCDGDRLILVSNYQDLTGNAGPDCTPFAKFSIVEGTTDMRLEAAIDHGQDGLRPYMSDPEIFKLASEFKLVMTENHATLINTDTGLYWVFSLEKATLVHAGNIFKGVTPEMIARGGFCWIVLCANPEKAGTVLISAQEEDFFLGEIGNRWEDEVNKLINMPGLTEEEIYKIWRIRYQEALDKSPFAAWYRLDPESGRVEKLREPPEGGTRLRGERWDYYIDTWRPMPDGSVKMGWRRSVITDKLEKSREKTETENGDDAAPPEGDAGGATQEGGDASGVGTGSGDGSDSAEKTADKEKQTEVAG